MNNETKKIGARMIPHFSDETGCYLSQGNVIWKYDYKTEKLRKVIVIKNIGAGVFERLKFAIKNSSIFLNYLSHSFGIGNISVSQHKHLIAFYDGLYYSNLNSVVSAPMERIDAYSELKISPPLFAGVAAHQQSGNFYFGEYINTDKDVRIIKFCPENQHISVVHTFKAGVVKHIHGIFYDEYRNRLWVTTGDKDKQCRILYTDDEFKTLQTLGEGDQSWRAVSVIPLEHGLLWGTDAGKDATEEDINKIFYYNFTNQERSEIGTIGNPAYHSARILGGGALIGCNFEPGRKQDTELASSIWCGFGDQCLTWRKLAKFDYAPGNVKWASKYGYVYLPKGLLHSSHIFYAVLNTNERDFATYSIRLDRLQPTQ